MFLKPRKDSTDPRLRSLLQKAVRRGFTKVADATARKLDALGDRTWLRSRAVVITFEECWPMGQFLAITREPESRFGAISSVSFRVKQKDAAGLGALAHEYHEGDRSMLDVVPDTSDLRNVSEALSRPAAFFPWARSQCRSSEASAVVEAAEKYLAAATWAWDKACILAGAYLASKGGLPLCSPLAPTDSEFPYWVALDKHTPQGKEVLQQIGHELGTSYRQLIWSGFYFESARVNAQLASPWFEAERSWRLRGAGLTLQTAERLWERVRPLLPDRLRSEAAALREAVDLKSEKQGSLF